MLLICFNTETYFKHLVGVDLNWQVSTSSVWTLHDTGCACREESACLHRLTAAWLRLKHTGPVSVVSHPLHRPARSQQHGSGSGLDGSQQFYYKRGEETGHWATLSHTSKTTDKLPLEPSTWTSSAPAELLRGHQYKLWLVVQWLSD